MSIRPLAEADAACGAKAHGLARLIAAGLRVPDGFVIEAEVFRDVTGLELPAELAREVADRAAGLGRLAVRSSASIEDGALGAAAEVFASLTDVAPGEVWPAIRAVWTSALTPLAVAYARRRGAAIAIAVIVQRFVPGARMTVYTRPIGAPAGDELWLSHHGQIERVLRSAACDRPEAALALAAEAAIGAAQGADVELVLEPVAGGTRSWLVQARPMLHPVRPVRRPPPPIVLAPLHDGRRWTWDIAHNPDPLSPAQAGLVALIDRAPWSPDAMRVCGGYLYTAPRAPIALPAPPADRAELAARIAAIEARLAGLLQQDAATVADAAQRYVAALQIWICELSPLVAAARRRLLDHLAALGHPPERIPRLAASLIGARRGPRDPVMSPAWDVAVPTFAETSAETRTAPRPVVPPDPPPALAAEVALARAAAEAAEHDDLWFARAQWLVRRALLARARERALR
ncbi:MAG: hypothetical protein E6J91_21525, partial [Deltaproteobacteria bacterium]